MYLSNLTESLDFDHISWVFQCNTTMKNTLTVKTLALVDTVANHTSSHLKKILSDTLKQLNISKQQVLACLVDNVSNMTRTVQLLNEDEGDKDDNQDIKKIQD